MPIRFLALSQTLKKTYAAQMSKAPQIDPRPVGDFVEPLPPGILPDFRPLHGRWSRLDPLSAERHGPSLYRYSAGHDDIWTYLFSGPFADQPSFTAWLKARQTEKDLWFYAYVKRDTGEALGMGSFMRAEPAHGVIEIGNIWMSPVLQRTREGTEAIYLMMRHAFDDLGMRRLEWKCNALNAPSRRAAERYGFAFEGVFRQHLIVKGHNRDTAWYSIIDKDWPRIKQGFEAWLADSNFDVDGQEKAKLRVA